LETFWLAIWNFLQQNDWFFSLSLHILAGLLMKFEKQQFEGYDEMLNCEPRLFSWCSNGLTLFKVVDEGLTHSVGIAFSAKQVTQTVVYDSQVLRAQACACVTYSIFSLAFARDFSHFSLTARKVLQCSHFIPEATSISKLEHAD